MYTLFVKSVCIGLPGPILRVRCALKDFKNGPFFKLHNNRTIFLSNSKQFLCNKNVSSSKLSLANRSTLYYVAAVGMFVCGMSYAAVPLYRIFCQAYSYGGTTGEASSIDVEKIKKVNHREIAVKFNADVSSSMQWNFKPQQHEIKVFPGETALAFYTARNPSTKPINGISTYNVVPFEAGQYFNKIQCFCFEEQILNPNEEVDMPVFFYIDPEFAEDPKMEFVSEITLSYTFFEAKPGLNLPLPGFVRPHGSRS